MISVSRRDRRPGPAGRRVGLVEEEVLVPARVGEPAVQAVALAAIGHQSTRASGSTDPRYGWSRRKSVRVPVPGGMAVAEGWVSWVSSRKNSHARVTDDFTPPTVTSTPARYSSSVRRMFEKSGNSAPLGAVDVDGGQGRAALGVAAVAGEDAESRSVGQVTRVWSCRNRRGVDRGDSRKRW